MWLFTRYGFFSVDGSADPEMVTIRARRKSHLQNLQSRFPVMTSAEIADAVERECRYRIVVPKADWIAAVTVLAEEQTSGGSERVDDLNRVWDRMYGLDREEPQRALVEWSDEGAVANAIDLTADDLAGQKVLCPACRRKVFASWPEGWDGHAGYACDVAGGTPEERKANFKEQYRRLFR